MPKSALTQETPAVGVDEVLSMMSRVPSSERGTAPYRWDRVGDAAEIARAIAHTAATRTDAADMVVYAIFESNNRSNAVGDGGRSYGAWQIKNTVAPPEVSLVPMRAAPVWLTLAAKTRELCASNAPEERLAALASGSCDRGKKLAHRRSDIARRLLAE